MGCEASSEEADVGDVDPCLCGGDGFLPVLGEPAAAPEPGERALHHPAPGQDLEALCNVGALDDFDGPRPGTPQGGPEFGAGVASVGKDMTQPWPARADRFQDRRRAVAVPRLREGRL